MDDELKIGATISRATMQKLQTAHDAMAALGVQCDRTVKELDPEAVAFFGDAVKALGDGKIGGYLVRHSGDHDPDLTYDFFDLKTNIHTPEILPVLYQHGMDTKIGKRILGSAKTGRDDVGLWIEAQLDMREKYEQALYKLAEQGKLGWSSGALSHLVEREPAGKAMHIKTWFIGEASLTPTPAEYRNSVIPLKSLITPEAAATDNGDVTIKAIPILQESNNMDTNEIKTLLEENNKSLVAVIEEKSQAAATKAVADVLDKLPEVKAKMNASIEVVVAEEDRPFKSNADYFMAVKNAALAPHAIDPKLKSMKATGYAEAQPSQAGFLVPQNTAAGIIEKMYATGSLLAQMGNRDRISSNNMTYNVVDETSRADGSRNGGVTGYWGAEGGTLTASKGRFRQMELKLKKLHAFAAATDEQLQDAPALESWLNRVVPNELRFKFEDAIINGDGVGKPAGILTSGAFKSATRTDASEIDALDLGRMWAARYAGVSDYIWLGNPSIFPQLLNLTIGQMPVFLAAGGVSGLPYATLLGRPYFDIEYAPTLGTLGDLMLVSPSQYQIIEQASGIQAASSLSVYFTTDEMAFRWTMRVDGAPIWNSVLTGKDSNTVSPFVGLAATT